MNKGIAVSPAPSAWIPLRMTFAVSKGVLIEVWCRYWYH